MGNVCPMLGNRERRRLSQDSEPLYQALLEADDIGNLFVSPGVGENASKIFKVANSSSISIVSCVGEPGAGKTKTINDLLELTGNAFRFPVHRDVDDKNLVLVTNGPMLKPSDGTSIFALDVSCNKNKRRAYLACVNAVLHTTSSLLIAVDQNLLERLPRKLQRVGQGYKREMACVIFRSWRVKKYNGENFEPRVVNIIDFLRIADTEDPLTCIVIKFVEAIRNFFNTTYLCFPPNESVPWVTRTDLMVLEQHFRKCLVINGEGMTVKSLVESVKNFNNVFYSNTRKFSRNTARLESVEEKIQEDVAEIYDTMFSSKASQYDLVHSVLSEEQVRIIHEDIADGCMRVIVEKYPTLDRLTRENLLPQLIHREYELQCEEVSAAKATFTESLKALKAYFEDVISIFIKYFNNSEYNFSVEEILAACLSEDIGNQLEACSLNKDCKNIIGSATTLFTADLHATQALLCEFKRRLGDVEHGNEYEITEQQNVWNMKSVAHRLACEMTKDRLRTFLNDSISSEFQRIRELKLRNRDVEELSNSGIGASNNTGARTLVHSDADGQLTISSYFDEDSRKQLGVHTNTLVGFLSVIGGSGSGKTTIINDLMQLSGSDRMFTPELSSEHERQVLVASRHIFLVGDMQEPIAIYPLDICCERGKESIYSSLSEFCLHISSCVLATVDEANVDSFPRNIREINGGEKREMICILFWNWDAYKMTRELFDCNVISAREFLSTADSTHSKTARALHFVKDLKPHFEHTYVCFPIRDAEGPELASWLLDGFNQLVEHFSKPLLMGSVGVCLKDIKDIVTNFNYDRSGRQGEATSLNSIGSPTATLARNRVVSTKYSVEKEPPPIISGRFEEEELQIEDDEYMRQILGSYHSEHFKEVEELFALGIKNGSEEITVQELMTNSMEPVLKESLETASKDVQELFKFIRCQFRADLETIRSVLDRCRRALTLVNSAEEEEIQRIRTIFITTANNTSMTCEMEKDRLKALLNDLVEVELGRFQSEMSNSQQVRGARAQNSRLQRTQTEIVKKHTTVKERSDLARRSQTLQPRSLKSNFPLTHGSQVFYTNHLRNRASLTHQSAVFETYPVRDSPRTSVDIHLNGGETYERLSEEPEGEFQAQVWKTPPEIHNERMSMSNVEYQESYPKGSITDVVAHALKMYRSFMNKAMDKAYFTNRNFHSLHNEVAQVVSYCLGNLLSDRNEDIKDIIMQVNAAIQIALEEFSRKNQTRISLEVKRERVVKECMEVFQNHLESSSAEKGGEGWREADIDDAKVMAQDYLEALTSDENDAVWKQWSEDLENNIESIKESIDIYRGPEPQKSHDSVTSEVEQSLKDELGELAVLIAEKLRKRTANTCLKQDAQEALKKAYALLRKDDVPLHQLKISLESLKILKETLGL